jgi:diacylglycerol kinase (ATP)
MNVLCFINPHAGGPVQELLGVLTATAGIDVQLGRTAGNSDEGHVVAKQVCEAQPDMVVAIGGDGTAGEVARGVLAAADAHRVPMLVAPGGTGNSNFCSLWNDRPWPAVVLDVFQHGRYETRAVDLMRLVELNLPTLLGVSSGFIPECLIAANQLPMSGRDRLLTAALQVLESYKPYHGRVTVDGVALCSGETFLVIVGGSPIRGGLLEVLPDALYDDGLLDVAAVMAHQPAQELVDAALAGRLVDCDGVYYGQGRSVRIERLDGQPLPLEHDGDLELGTHSSYELQMMLHAIHMIVPHPPPKVFGAY